MKKLFKLMILSLASLFVLPIVTLAEETEKSTFDITEITISDVHKAMEKGEITSKELVELYLKRINELDMNGPKINSIITVNPNAIKVAEELDAEFKTTGFRGPLHGIPIIVKDNYDTYDMPTTAGSASLKDSIPPDDSYAVKKLREAGAIIIGKGNMDEWAHGGVPGGGYSSVGGQTLNPYKLSRGPGGSSGGPAAGVAANLSIVGMGSDTLGSIRGPVANNGLVGIKPTLGLASRDGIIPFSSAFDVIGPMTRTVEDSAIVLGVISGMDVADPATYQAIGKTEKDYTKFLNKNGLKGARIGVIRNYFGANKEVDASVNQAIKDMQKNGAKIIDNLYVPQELIDASGTIYSTISDLEFKWELEQYLKTLDNQQLPQNLDEVIEDAANIPIYSGVLERLKTSQYKGPLTDPYYLANLKYGPQMFRDVIDTLMEENELDALVFPTSSCPAAPIQNVEDPSYTCGSAPGSTNLASLSGYPSVSIPSGFTSDGLPISVSLLGEAFSEPTLIKLAYSYEQATQHRKAPEFLANN